MSNVYESFPKHVRVAIDKLRLSLDIDNIEYQDKSKVSTLIGLIKCGVHRYIKSYCLGYFNALDCSIEESNQAYEFVDSKNFWVK